MNISKLLKITALCCIGVFSANNNIVNASEDKMDIDSNIDTENNNDANNLALELGNININYNTQNIIEEALGGLYNQNNLVTILSVNDCNVEAFPQNRIILITNGHNFFIYRNGIVTVCYNANDLDGCSEEMTNITSENLKGQIMNLFSAMNISFNDQDINSILDNNAHDRINEIVNSLFDSYWYYSTAHDNYDVIC